MNRPNRGSNPSKVKKHRSGKFLYIRRKNRAVRELLRAQP